jgi:hypothetical protein
VASLVARVFGGEIVTYELTMRSTNSSAESWLRLSGSPLRDVDGEISGVAVVISDVTRERPIRAGALDLRRWCRSAVN